jgi:hypothetical protein
LKRSNLVAFLALIALAVLAVFSQADALQFTKAYKFYSLTIYVTPSPAPLVMRHAAPRPATAPPRPEIARLVSDPYSGPAIVASSASAWDVPPMLLAQTSAQPAPVPVQFVAKADPNAAYLRIIPQVTSTTVPYGTTTITCALQIFTYYTTTYNLTDWGQGTVSNGSGPFPVENYPTASYLSWTVPDFATTLYAYANSGSPGQKTWSGTAGQSQQHCVDLTITVPNSQPATTPTSPYVANIQYNLIVN